MAPPSAKSERMVKHIKKAYSKDGNLTDKEKSIAYATAWKHHNKEAVEDIKQRLQAKSNLVKVAAMAKKMKKVLFRQEQMNKNYQ